MDETEATRRTAPACAEEDDVGELARALARAHERCERMEEAREEGRELVHALANVLSVITAFTSSLAEEPEAGPLARETVEELVGAAKRAGTITRALGTLLRRPGRGEPEAGPRDHGRA